MVRLRLVHGPLLHAILVWFVASITYEFKDVKGTTKLMGNLFTAELQRRLDAEAMPITVIAVHPGTVSTGTPS